MTYRVADSNEDYTGSATYAAAGGILGVTVGGGPAEERLLRARGEGGGGQRRD